MARWIWAVVAVAGCAPTQQYSYKASDSAAEQDLPRVEAGVVSAREAEQSGLAGRPLVLPFAGPRDGTELVAQYLQDADRAGAQLISELAIIIESTRGDRPVACRTEVALHEVSGSADRADRGVGGAATAPTGFAGMTKRARTSYAMTPRRRRAPPASGPG